MQWNRISKAGLTALAMTLAWSAQAASNGVIVTVVPAQHLLASADDVVVDVTITNTSSKPQTILK